MNLDRKGPKLVAEQTGFVQRVARDALGRKVRYYLSAPPANENAVPLAIVLQGSGCHSVFQHDPKTGRVTGRHQVLFKRVSQNLARVIAVEKPGVTLFDNPKSGGEAGDCSAEFCREHTLDRWTEAIRAAIMDAQRASPPGDSRILIIGHSEGGIVAASVAATMPAVSHVALFSSSGPTQLFDFIVASRRQNRERKALKCITATCDTFRRIAERPNAAAEHAWGHPYRRWSSFLAHSTLDLLRQSEAAVFIAHGTADEIVPIEAAEVLYSELVRSGRNVQMRYCWGADHAFNSPASCSVESIITLYKEVLQWAQIGSTTT